MIATLSKNTGGTSWSVGDERSYDVWGGVRSGSGPKNGYVANLGHVKDDESGLIYMRARYYEPESGRFVSEDPAMADGHWYAYADSSPTNKVDPSGQSSVGVMLGVLFAYYSFTAMFWKPGSAEDRIVKLLLDSVVGYLGIIDVMKSVAQNADPRMKMTGGEAASMLALGGCAVVLVAIAAYQMGLLMYMAWGEGDFDMLGATAFGTAGDAGDSINGLGALLAMTGRLGG
ncbi:MAG: RHS repeat-associated core domain-containing protein [Fimbriimonadaceae bacterium]